MENGNYCELERRGYNLRCPPIFNVKHSQTQFKEAKNGECCCYPKDKIKTILLSLIILSKAGPERLAK